MRRIKFDTIDMSYFLSCGEKVSHKFEDGIFFIRGENRTAGQEGQNNGVGKTNIFFDSLVFALYGETSRKKFPKDSIPFNRGGKKKCIVELKFDIEEDDKVIPVIINRTINPSKLNLTVNGEDKTQSNSPATQAFIANTLLKGIKKDVFMQSMATKADSSSFFSMLKIEREKFIGTIFDFTYIKDAEKLAREEYNEVSKKVGKKQTEIDTSTPQLDVIKNQIKTAKAEVQLAKNRKLDKIAQIQERLDNLLKGLGVKPDEIDVDAEAAKYSMVLTKIETKMSDLNRNVRELSSEIRESQNTVSSNLSEIERKTKAKVCGECNREIAKAERDILDKDCARMSTENVSLKKLIIEGKTQFKKLQEEVLSLEQKENKISKAKSNLLSTALENQKEISDYEKLATNIKSLEDEKKVIEDEIDAPTDSSILKTLIKDYTNTEEKIAAYHTEYDKLHNELEVLNCVKIVFSEKGLRSAILSKLIDLFNSSLNNYLMRLKAPCQVLFDENMEYSMKTLGGIDMQYESFSGGEKWRINMALFLTFSDILRIQNQISFNVKLIDESFDYAVDQSGLDAISEILIERQKEHGENPYIITHKTQFDIPDAEIINVVKEKGMSRILK